MDPRDRADAVLSRAQARAGVVTPDNMTSPMDAADTQQIPGSVVRQLEKQQDPDTTTKLPASLIASNDASHLAQSQPTVPLPTPTGEGMPDGATTPMPVPARPAAPERQPAEADAGPEITEVDGLVPTTRTTAGKSELARRLEGL
ncbi:hypothetical protein ACFS2C_20260 [Prauserella oleivorans]|uniref:Uncharacterized protein n=1 Tax=Prauserella oleivorans TaxID=1478153 RepID=A0ABW5WF36_9PSEU